MSLQAIANQGFPPRDLWLYHPAGTIEITNRMPDTDYPYPLDAIVLAGTDYNPKRLIRGDNKAFLEIAGRPLVRHVVDALLGASSIGMIFVVGPSERLRQALPASLPSLQIVEQAGKMLVNTWAAIHAAEAGHEQRDESRPMLFISCDIPLISPAAIDDFIARCARQDQKVGTQVAMHAGIAEEASLSPYYPTDGAVGIRRPCVHLSTGLFRLANIYVARPRLLAHQEFLQTGFSYRKAGDWRNVLALAKSFFGQHGGWRAAWITLRLQATLLASRRKGRLYRRLRRGNTPERVEYSTGTVLGGSVCITVTPYGGLSLDVDDEGDFRVLEQRFNDWKDIDPTAERPSRVSS